MGNNKNDRITRNTVYLTIRTLLIMFISLYTSRIVLDKLGVEDFGIYNVVGGFVSIFSFLKTSFSSVSQRFLNISLGRDDYPQARKIFSQHLLLYSFTIFLIIILSETFGYYFVCNKLVIPPERLQTAIIIYHFSIITICINIWGIVYNSAIIAHENMKVFSYIGVIEGLIKLMIAFALIVCNTDKLLVYGFLMLLSQLGIVLFNYFYCRAKYSECRFYIYWNKNDIKQSLRLIGWDFVNNITFVIKDQFLTILLNLFFGPVVNAARAITGQVNMAVNNFSIGFLTSVKPQIVKSYAQDDKKYLFSLFFKSSKFSYYIFYSLFLPISLNINAVLALWLKIVPPYTNWFVIFNLMESICATLLSPMSTMTLATGRMRKYVLLCNTANIMVFPLCYICFSLGLLPVWAYIIAFAMRLMEVCLAAYCSNKVIGYGLLNYLRYVIKPCFLVSIVSLTCTLSLKMLLCGGIIELFISTIFSVVVIVVSIWLFGTTSNEREYLVNMVRKQF